MTDPAAHIRAAQRALDTHDDLQVAWSAEPNSEQAPEGWLEWQKGIYRPAYETWSDAMDTLADTGYDGGRHAFNFRPYCEAVITRPAMHEGGTT